MSLFHVIFVTRYEIKSLSHQKKRTVLSDVKCAGSAPSFIARANAAPRCTSFQNAETISKLRDSKSTVPINHITGTACVSWEGFA